MRKILFLLSLFVAVCPLLVSAQGCVDINTGSLVQMEELDGIGPTKAQAIIDSRPYSSIDDLDRAKGIGSATLAKIKTQGLASVNCSTQNPNVQSPNPNQIPIAQNEKTAENGSPPITYPRGIFINEILPNPQGEDSLEEWIELYNSSSVDVGLSGWQLKDVNGTITTYTIPNLTKILANNYLVFKRPETKIMLNNDEDGVNLLTPDKKIVDSISFIKAPLNQSYIRTSSGWVWSTVLTPGAKNIIPSALPKEQKSDNNGNIKAENLTAGLIQPITPGINPWPMFLIVLSLTIVLALIVLFIKLKIKI